jgi:phosphatidylinositol alpha-1,6-mannosyltransferase
VKRNILILASEFPPGPGGIGHHAWFLAKELSTLENTKIEVLCPKDYATEDEVIQFDSASHFEIHRLERVKGFTYLLRITQLIRLLTKKKYTHFWSSGKFPLWMIWVQKVFAPEIRTLCILHGSEVNLRNTLLRKLTHYSISQFETIVSVSTFTQKLLPNWILQTHQGLFVIPNGLDKSDFMLNGNIQLTGYPVLLTVGHVSPRKGQHRLIKALPKIIEQYPEVQYHLVGRPIDQKRLEFLAKELGVSKHVVFHGSVKNHYELWGYYAAADVFILLSENQPNGDVEGFGIVALEANACGIPVLGAKGCGVEEAVSNLKSGYLVDGDDVIQILEGVIFCVENKRILTHSSKDWAHNHHWSIILHSYINLL